MNRFSDNLNRARQTSYYFDRAAVLFFVFLLVTAVIMLKGNRYASANSSFTPVELMVTRSDDRANTCVSGVDCSLREAITTANASAGDERITFAPNIATIALNSGLGEFTIQNNGSLEIEGPGADRLTITSIGRYQRIFYTNGARVNISGVRLTGALIPFGSMQGAAIFVNAGSLTLDRVVVTGNDGCAGPCNLPNGGSGGGVYYNGGTNHLIMASTFSNNKATTGGGIDVEAGAVVAIVNSTFSGNSAFEGAAIACGGRVDLRNVTITKNLLQHYGISVPIYGSGPGAYLAAGGSMTFGNSIISDNSASFIDIKSDGGQAISLGHNQVGSFAGASNSGGGVIYAASDILDISPRLTPLGMYGGPTPTHGIMRGSPVVNRGDNSLAVNPLDNTPLTTDQRGYQRIASGFGGVPTVDIGAFEFRAFPGAVGTGD